MGRLFFCHQIPMHWETKASMKNRSSSQRQKFPFEVKRGSAVVKIYLTPTKGRDCYTLVFWVNRERRRRTFADFDEARAEAERIAIQLTAGDLDVAKLSRADCACYLRARQLADSVGTPLEEVAAQFVTAKQALGPIPLRDAVEYFLKRNPRGITPRLVSEVISEMTASKRADALSPLYCSHLKYDLDKFAKAFNCDVGSVRGVDIDSWLRALDVAPRTRNNLRNSVQTLFSYAKARKYLPKDHDELDAVPLVKDRKGSIEIFTPFELASMLVCADESLVPFLALGAFAGIRHAEIQRLDWQDIRFEDDLIEITAAKAKTASRRTVPLLENLKKWLIPLRKPGGLVCAYKCVSNEIDDLEQRVNAKWQERGITRKFTWKRNALRHSFISYRVSQIQNVQQVALEAGNSPQIIFSNYRELVRPADAQKWFSIVPAQEADVIQLFAPSEPARAAAG
jgi:integrase